MLRSEIEEEVGRLLGDPQHDRWSTTVIDERSEFAQQEIQAITGAVKTLETLTPTAETNEVTVATNVLDINRVTLAESDGTIHILKGISREDLDYYYPNWQNDQSGLPSAFAWDPSNRQLILYIKPSSAYAITDGLKVWEVRTPAALSTAADEPFDGNVLMRPYSLSVVHWVVAQCWMDDGTPEALAKAKFHKSGSLDRPGEYEKQIQKINARFASPTEIPAQIRWKPQGGLIHGGRLPSKRYPLG